MADVKPFSIFFNSAVKSAIINSCFNLQALGTSFKVDNYPLLLSGIKYDRLL